MKPPLLLLSTVLVIQSAWSQPAPPPMPKNLAQPPAPPGAATAPSQQNFDSFTTRLNALTAMAAKSASPPEPVLTKFSLDFPGGTPKQLVAAIEKAKGKPLNAIIPEAHAAVQIPPLRMNNIDVPQLFKALERASLKSESPAISDHKAALGGAAPSLAQTTFSFQTQGAVSDDSIWYFYVDKPNLPSMIPKPQVCRYFSLAPYLDRGSTVEDITTAIQTGWKMLGEGETPQLNFHKETKLLIAVGEASKVETIDAVLAALKNNHPEPAPKLLAPPAPIPAPKQ